MGGGVVVVAVAREAKQRRLRGRVVQYIAKVLLQWRAIDALWTVEELELCR